MGAISLIIGAGVIVLVLAYILFKLSETSEGKGSKHFLLQLLIFFLIFGLILVIGKGVVDDRDECTWNIVNSTKIGSTTFYGQEYQCSADTNNTADILFDITTWFFRLGTLYIFLYFTYTVLEFLNVQIPFVQRVVDKMNNKKKGKDKGFGGKDDDDE